MKNLLRKATNQTFYVAKLADIIYDRKLYVHKKSEKAKAIQMRARCSDSPSIDLNVELKKTNFRGECMFSLNGTNDLIVKSNKNLINDINIPSDVLDLLWFCDGLLKNYDLYDELKDHIIELNIKEKNYDLHDEHQDHIIDLNMQETGKIYVPFISKREIEPSLIATSLPVDFSTGIVEKLPFYPIYKEMTPLQRGKYLTWLTNIDNPIEIGYVFLFYYGLERFLYKCPNKFEQAYNMILRLRKHHKEASFPSYSFMALVSANILRQDAQAIKEIIDAEGSTVKISLAVKAGFDIPLNAKDIINIASLVGFTNKRYINTQYVEFCNALDKNLIEKYGKPFYYIDKNFFSNSSKKVSLCLAANCSLEKRDITFKDITHNETFRKGIYDLLQMAHESVKGK